MSSFTYTLDALVAAIVISWIVNYLETRQPPGDRASKSVAILNEDEFKPMFA